MNLVENVANAFGLLQAPGVDTNRGKNPLAKSVYTNTQFTNVPGQVSYPYYLPHLSGNIPQTHWPYDSVYDTTWQNNISHPKYRWYGNMEYPYYTQRHRTPKVFTRPKPMYWKNNGFYYKIPSYPPYIYWYPNPYLCRDMCGDEICNEYFIRINDYRNCQRCQKRDPPQCWDPKSQKCINCPPELALEKCSLRKRFGCTNPNGYQHTDVPPINPLYTGCKMCS